MSISWGRRERYKFRTGGVLKSWVPPAGPAVYAITYKQDPHNKPKAHTVLYFGQAADLAEEAPNLNRKVLESWADTGGGVDDLYVFVLPMSGSSGYDRLKIQQQLVGDYRPFANDN